MANKIQVATLALSMLGCLFAYKSWDDAHMARLNALDAANDIDFAVGRFHTLKDAITEVSNKQSTLEDNVSNMKLACDKDHCRVIYWGR